MQDYKASYILTKSEMLFLLSSASEGRPTQSALYAINEYLRGHVPTQDTVESLVGKKLVRKTAGSISVEPVVDLLIKSALLSECLWELRNADSVVLAAILRSEALFLLVTRYKHIENNWKVTPFQDKSKLTAELADFHISNIIRVDCDGGKKQCDSIYDLLKEET